MNLKDETILITGVCGTVGKSLLEKVIAAGVDRIIGVDNDESGIFYLSQKYKDRAQAQFYIGDVRDKEKLIRKARGIDIILHSAALKHVTICESAPRDAVLSNIIGVQNVIDAAQANGVRKILFTSSDKAVNPTNVMGTSKLMGERLFTAANAHRRSADEPIFFSTRFGNVLGSRGSVIPVFAKQIRDGKSVTLTNPEMTRFVMTISQAADLVLDTVSLAKGGEVFVTKMPVIRIVDLAEVMIELLAPMYQRDPEDIHIKVIGQLSGEKLYEELMSSEEMRRTTELDKYFVVKPAFDYMYNEINFSYPGENPISRSEPYNSSIEKPMDKKELKEYIIKHKLLQGFLSS